MDAATTKILEGIKNLADWGGTHLQSLFTYFLELLGNNVILLIPITMMLVLFAWTTLKRILHGV